MKKIVLVGVNAKYIHTNLAIRSLKKATQRDDVILCEVTINDQIHNITEKLLHFDADAYGFSCYIWNMEMIVKIGEVLKKSKPECYIFWGGPEVSYDSGLLLEKYTFVDYILAGEGEGVFLEFLEALEKGDSHSLECMGGSQRKTLSIVENLDDLRFPYSEHDIEVCKGKIIYYESMRGCPFKCSYCLSSTLKTVRFLPLARVFKEIDFFIDRGVKQVKFVDRTFNVNLKRTKTLIAYLIKRGGHTNFHFEISGDLLDDELIDLIGQAPKGLMQFEIGVQSTDENTLAAITRKTDLEKIRLNVCRLIKIGNCHVHMDLIAGLPYESYNVFKKSFNETIDIKPDMLQLGFLKLLKGTKIRDEKEEHGYAFTSFPPYEVISNQYISAKELVRLKNIETLLERYYNSGDFKLSLNYIFGEKLYGTPFDFFEKYADFWLAKGYYEVGKSKDQLYEILINYMRETVLESKVMLIIELIKFDYLNNGCRSLPAFFENNTLRKEEAFDFLKEMD
ncbi:MAG: DUF4080 domain-containing protein, partial [Eubacterium sp.]